MTCMRCRGDGVFFAHHKYKESGAYVFRCTCEAGNNDEFRKGVIQWDYKFESRFVPEYTDKKLTDAWVIRMTKEKKTNDPEFQRRMNIWGRDRFKKIWRRHLNKNSASPGDDDSDPSMSMLGVDLGSTE